VSQQQFVNKLIWQWPQKINQPEFFDRSSSSACHKEKQSASDYLRNFYVSFLCKVGVFN